jgi:hypothetical protein
MLVYLRDPEFSACVSAKDERTVRKWLSCDLSGSCTYVHVYTVPRMLNVCQRSMNIIIVSETIRRVQSTLLVMYWYYLLVKFTLLLQFTNTVSNLSQRVSSLWDSNSSGTWLPLLKTKNKTSAQVRVGYVFLFVKDVHLIGVYNLQ